MSVQLDKALLLQRLLALYSFWKTDKGPLSSVKAFVILKGKEDDSYSKSQSLHMWLTDHVIPDTVLLFSQSSINIFASKKKAEFLKVSDNDKENYDLPPIKVFARDSASRDKETIQNIIEVIQSTGNSIGYIAKDKPQGDFISDVLKAIDSHSINKVDVSESISRLLAVKDSKEVEILQKASEVTCTLLTKYIRAEAVEAIEEDRKVKHSRISAGCEEALKNKKFNLGLDEDNLEMCYPAIIQSKENFNLKFSCESSDANLKPGTLIFAVGVRHHGYCSNVIRSYLVNPSPEQSEVYSYLFLLHEFILNEIKEGMVFCDIYNLVKAKIDREKPTLSDRFLPSLGFVTGIEFRDSNLVINGKNKSVFTKHMSININIGFQDVEILGEGKRKINDSFWLGDIVLVEKNSDGQGVNLVLTKQCRSALSKVTMTIQEEAESEVAESSENEEETNKKKKRSEVIENEILGRGQRNAGLAQKTRNEAGNNLDERMSHQLELYEKLLDDVKERLTGLKTNTEKEKKVKNNVSYRGIGQMPKEEDVRKLRLFVDKKYESVIVPIFGTPYPLHISTFKNVATSVAGDYTYLRINFYHPGVSVNPKDAPAFQDVDAFYLKELTLQASNVRVQGDTVIPSTNLNTAFRLIKELQKRYKTKEAEEREMMDLVEQDKLITMSKAAAVLKDVYMRPNAFGKRLLGQLEAHSNGFRYCNIRGDKIEFLYSNIKHAFYQPCDGEMIILIHFHLKNGVMINKKKHVDLQFYTEVGETSTDLDRAQGYSYKDRDDLESEQRERELRNKLKKAFLQFCEQASTASQDVVDFDTPFRELGFHGAPARSTVLLQPASTCLVSLVEWPPFVVPLDEIDFVYFERVGMNIRTFDLVFVMKDYTAKPLMISSISANSLEDIKNWLDSNDIFFSEGIKSLNWPKLLKVALDDPIGFLEEGGWSILKPLDDEDEEEEEEEMEDDEEFRPSEDSEECSESGSSEDSEDEESDWSAENDSGSGSEELDSDESEGKDWDELLEMAAEEDKKKDIENIEDSGRGKKRQRSPVQKSKKKTSKEPPSKKAKR